MTELTWEQVLENRRKAIEFLQQPQRKKAKGVLDKGGGQRCCLGHMSVALKIRRVGVRGEDGAKFGFGDALEERSAPEELVHLLGLWTDYGGGVDESEDPVPLKHTQHGEEITSLVVMNDETVMTPQRIGVYLERVIEGGVGTPFKPQSEFK